MIRFNHVTACIDMLTTVQRPTQMPCQTNTTPLTNTNHQGVLPPFLQHLVIARAPFVVHRSAIKCMCANISTGTEAVCLHAFTTAATLSY